MAFFILEFTSMIAKLIYLFLLKSMLRKKEIIGGQAFRLREQRSSLFRLF
jgi:hypothetical protein